MTNTHDHEQKLAMLRTEYKKKLPEKIEELNVLWQQILTANDAEDMKTFHRKAHSLHGTAYTYRYIELGKTAAKLEEVLNNLINNPSEFDNSKTKIASLLTELHTLATQEEHINVSEINDITITETSIFLLEQAEKWEANLNSQMLPFGYTIQRFSNVESFIEQIKNQRPSLLIINIDLINSELEKILIENNAKNMNVPIIFLATSGEFSLRLKTVRLGGEAYLIKPFLTEDLIIQVNNLLKLDADPYRVLIVDDEKEIADYNSAILEQAKIKTFVINKAQEIDHALHEFRPDLILTDIIMPECSGVELAKIIRQQSMFQSTPIIYLSAEEDRNIQIKAMQLGADDFLNKSTQPDYLVMTVKNRIERSRKLRSLMMRDNLTGLYNQAFIQNQLDIELKESMQLHNPLSIALIDLDQFKIINNTYGHQAGDHVFRSLALMIRKQMRTNDIVGRYSGEKILVILPNTALEQAKTLIDDLRKKFLTLNYSWNQQIFNATFSAGVASFPEFHTTVELLEAAEKSIVKSKKLGRNRVETIV